MGIEHFSFFVSWFSYLSHYFCYTETASHVKRILVLLVACILITSCNPTKFVPAGGHIYKSVDVKIDNKKISKSSIQGLMQQNPVKQVLGIPVGVWLYNVSDTGVGRTKLKRWTNGLFQKMGQQPVVFDTTLYFSSLVGVEQFLKTKGYYNAKISDTILYRKNYADIKIKIEAGQPYKISDFYTVGMDSSIVNFVKGDSLSTLISKGDIFDTDKLEKERERVAMSLKNKGYFFFNKNYVVYEVDTSFGNKTASIKQVVKNIMSYNASKDSLSEVLHSKYMIKNVNVYTNYDRVEALTNSDYLSNFTEKTYDGIRIWSNGDRIVTPELILRSLKIRPNTFYSQNSRIETENNFSALKIFRTIEIQYDTTGKANAGIDTGFVHFSRPLELNCNIYLTPMLLQSYKLEGELFLSSDYWGVELSGGYTHRNIFKGAELFNINVNGTVPFNRGTSTAAATNFSKSTEFGVASSINIPRFIMPFKANRFFNVFAPRTQFSLGYNYQSREIYTRNMVSFGFGYNWAARKNLSMSYTPINLDIIKMHNASSLGDYLQDQKLLATAFSDHFISSGKLSLVYNTQKINSLQSYYYTMLNFELAGNLMSLANGVLKEKTLADGTKAYSVWGMPYSQFMSTDFTSVLNYKLDSKNRLVARFQLGVAYPYGNSTALPYEKYFFVGGANSMRGWQVRTLGPGVASDTSSINGLLNIGDFKLEANVEYRFKIVWSFEGALFVDAGNVWFLPHNKKDKSMTFDFSNFYKQLAANSGLGLRLNLGYLLVRFDAGIRMVDPSKPKGERFLPSHGLSTKDISYHIGVGYPF